MISDQDLVLEAIEFARYILAEYRPGASRQPETTINQLLFVLDRQDLSAAQKRLRAAGYGLRLVK
jgi:hypothetical protein